MVSELAIEWFEPLERVLDASRGVEWARWFTGGKLNIAWNCLDRHADGANRDRLAVIWESEDGGVREDILRGTSFKDMIVLFGRQYNNKRIC